MIICPNLTHPDVAREFNELKEATSEKAAYHIWSANNGNNIDKAPNGAKSVLFDNLLQLTNGDRTSAIRLKAKIYSKSFSDWFGDWINDQENSSKAVDINGEPLILWHGTKNKFDEFKIDAVNDTEKHNVHTGNAFFFTNSKQKAAKYQGDIQMPVFLNMRNVAKSDVTDGTFESINDYLDNENKLINDDKYDSAIFVRFDKEGENHGTTPTTQWLVKSPNQIQSVNNEGYFSKNNNIYDTDAVKRILGDDVDESELKYVENFVKSKIKQDLNITLQQAVTDGVDQYYKDKFSAIYANIKFQFQNFNPTVTFGDDITSALNSNNAVSSSIIIKQLLNKNIFLQSNIKLAEILQVHDIPVKLIPSDDNILCKAVSDKDGGTVIIINSNVSNGVSNTYLGQQILHEAIHALTVNAINNPTTKEQIEFARKNKELFELFDQVYPKDKFDRLDQNGNYYILANEKEFAAVFMTDKDARNMLYVKAYQLDKSGDKHIINKLKAFINSLTKFFVNKHLFKTNVDKLSEYENEFKKYLLGLNKVKLGNITDKQLFNIVYKSINANTLSNEQLDQIYKKLNYILSHYEQNNSFHVDDIDLSINRPDTDAEAMQKLQKLSEKVALGLSQRLKAVMSSNLPEDKKQALQKELDAQISQFKQGAKNSYMSILLFLRQVAPSLIEDSDKILKAAQNNEAVNPSELQYYIHDNFGMYEKLLEYMTKELQSNAVVTELLRQSMEAALSKDATFRNIDEIINAVNDCKTVCDNAKAALDITIINTAKKILADVGKETHSPTMVEYLNCLQDIGFDTSVFYKYFGMVDKVQDEGIRSIVYLINGAINKAQREEAGKRNEIAKAISKLAFTEHCIDIYEKDSKGRTTQYLIRDLNYGQFRNDYQEFLKQLNKQVSQKYGIMLQPDNFQAPTDRIPDKSGKYEDCCQEWNEKLNEWLGKHCERKFKPEYYKAYSRLSNDTRVEYNNIMDQIRAIRAKCKDKDGHFRFDQLSDEDKDLLDRLNIHRRMMMSDRDITGELKVGDQLRMAKELQRLNQELHPNKTKIKRDVEAWQKARNKVIEECGGIEEYKKYMNAEENNFDGKKLSEWDKYNSRKVLKQDKDGNVLLFKALDDQFGEIVYEVNGDGGKAYKEVTDQINDIVSTYRSATLGELSWRSIPKSQKIKLNKLLIEQAKIRNQAYKQNIGLRKLAKLRGMRFSSYIMKEKTQSFYELQRYASEMSIEDPDMYDVIMSEAYSNFSGDICEDQQGELLRWFTKIVAKPQYQSEFGDFIPGDGWVLPDEQSELFNKNYDINNSEKLQPKRFDENGKKLYDNTQNFNKVMKSKSLKNLYDVSVNTIHEINQLYGREHANDYLLPGIVGSSYKRIKSSSNILGATWGIIKDAFGIGEQSVQQDEEFAQDPNRILDSTDEFGNLLQNQNMNLDIKSRPDGHELNMIPRYYTLRLQDPSQLSADLGEILTTAHEAALKFKYKMEVKDKCETLSDMMERRTVTKRQASNRFKRTRTQGKDSNTYQVSQKFLKMNMYNIRQADHSIPVNWFNNKKVLWHWQKIVKLLSAATVVINLGANFTVAAVGFLGALLAHVVQSIVGQHYSAKDGAKASVIFAHHMFKNLFGAKYIANKTSNDKMMLITEYFNVSDQGHRKLHNSNRNVLLNAINDNKTFGFLSGFDYIVKSQITIATLLGFHYYKGEFCTKEDMVINLMNASDSERKKAMKEWRDGKDAYSILSVRDGNLVVDEKYLNEFNKIKNLLHNRVIKYAESADGMMTETQKAQITTNFIGQLMLIHRQYAPLLLAERFGDMVYDEDTQQMAGGIFKSGTKGLWYFANIVSKFLCGTIKNVSISEGYNEARQYYNSKFNDKSSTLNYMRSQTMKYQLKQIMIELLIWQMCASAAAFVYYSAKNERDRKRKKLLWLMSYIAHRNQWEFATPYRANDMFNNVKTLTAATGTTDKIDNFLESFNRRFFPSTWGNLYDTFGSGSESNKKYESTVKSGVYKGWDKWQRDLFKFTPYHNIFEQLYGSDAKDRYYVHEIMKQND